jgi:ABC-type nitrate/sulfonate/bicarbonate transport system permease component
MIRAKPRTGASSVGAPPQQQKGTGGVSPGVRKAAMTLVSLTAFVAIWQLSDMYVFNPRLVPSPATTVVSAWAMLRSGDLEANVGISLWRILVGYAAGCALGIFFGGLIGRVAIIRDLADPLLEMIRPISPVAIVPLAMLWFGIGETSKYFVIGYATVIVVLLNTAAGVSRTPRTRIRAALSLGATELQVFLKVVLPSAIPYVLTGMRVALGFAFMGVVAAELIGAHRGIGFLIMNSQMLMQTDQLFVGLLALSIVGATTDRVFRYILDRSMKRYMQFLEES